MAKKGKDDAPTASSVANRDIIQRLNFLYQASVYLSTLPSAPSSSDSTSLLSSNGSNAHATTDDNKVTKGMKGMKDAKAAKRTVTARDLSRTYIDTMKIVGQKTTVKIDPAVKRTLCKGCNLTLIPGSTASVRVKKSPVHGHTMVYTCTACNTSRRIPAPPVLSAQGLTATQSVISSASASTAFETPSTTIDDITMDVEHPPATSAGKSRTRGKRKSVQSRLPPLFVRNVGHVVFCGNDKLVDEGLGDGVFIT
ncbi:hypothetical protein DXG03_005589 [Asterophora parasitica]|uniref:Rpr2-domain-containing protein n=1 Tax=Asterophora parasitica TaxID=117018 RepID=A0A9P7KAW3_9AGAR|nr:hypothetical protein DXG03_005589 [Asterophora parasitica]